MSEFQTEAKAEAEAEAEAEAAAEAEEGLLLRLKTANENLTEAMKNLKIIEQKYLIKVSESAEPGPPALKRDRDELPNPPKDEPPNPPKKKGTGARLTFDEFQEELPVEKYLKPADSFKKCFVLDNWENMPLSQDAKALKNIYYESIRQLQEVDVDQYEDLIHAQTGVRQLQSEVLYLNAELRKINPYFSTPEFDYDDEVSEESNVLLYGKSYSQTRVKTGYAFFSRVKFERCWVRTGNGESESLRPCDNFVVVVYGNSNERGDVDYAIDDDDHTYSVQEAVPVWCLKLNGDVDVEGEIKNIRAEKIKAEIELIQRTESLRMQLQDPKMKQELRISRSLELKELTKELEELTKELKELTKGNGRLKGINVVDTIEKKKFEIDCLESFIANKTKIYSFAEEGQGGAAAAVAAAEAGGEAGGEAMAVVTKDALERFGGFYAMKNKRRPISKKNSMTKHKKQVKKTKRKPRKIMKKRNTRRKYKK
uniref:Uncharacterized protein n=1 Tax=viral metagenome TaxID=1070528 RepID=A0A6C0JIS5_9ZZZZ